MLNYIWAGLIAFSLLFALVSDGLDLARDPYRNGRPLPVTVRFPGGYDPASRRADVAVEIDSVDFRRAYDRPAGGLTAFEGTLLTTADGRQLRFAKDADVPEPLATVRTATSARDNDVRGTLAFTAAPGDTAVRAAVTFAPVRFVKLQAITKAAFSFAETAVTVALGLIGVLALWLGLLRIAEKSGLIESLVKYTQPFIRPLFPGIPRDHPAYGMIVLNLTANMLGLGNAATPLGIKAMEEMQKLNPDPDTATDDMVMFMAINTASVQLVPPVLLVAILGLEVNRLIFPIILVTFLSTIVAIVAARTFSKLRRFRTPPDNGARPAPADPAPAR